MELHLNDKAVLVTGGTKNLGRAVAEAFLAEGAAVLATYRHDAAAAQAMERRLRPTSGNRLLILQADACQLDLCQHAVSEAIASFGRLDVLINNAAVLLRHDPIAVTDETFETVMNNCLRGILYMTQAAWPHFAKARAGRIVNLSTAGTQTANPNELTYLAAKAGVEAATRAYCRLGAPLGITANAVAPHVITSGLGQETLARDPSIVSRIPLGRPGRIDELVALVLFLSSDVCQYLTGQTIFLTGGRVMH